MDQLTKLRNKIDRIDSGLVKLLGQRMEVVKKVSEYKKTKGIPALDQKRWNAVLNSKMKKAKKAGLDVDLVREIYELIHEYALRIEE